jgi:DNA-binding XRE family transcriptional regulator
MTSTGERRAFRAFLEIALKEPGALARGTRPWEKAEIADRFRALRRKAHLTQRRLGRLIKADRKTINRIENLHSMPHQGLWNGFCKLEAAHNQPQIVLGADWLKELAAELDCPNDGS